MDSKQMEQKIINKMLALLGVCGVSLCSCEALWDVGMGPGWRLALALWSRAGLGAELGWEERVGIL